MTPRRLPHRDRAQAASQPVGDGSPVIGVEWRATQTASRVDSLAVADKQQRSTPAAGRLPRAPTWYWPSLMGELVRFIDTHRHSNVPPRFVTESGYPLGRAVLVLRRRCRDGVLSPPEVARFDRLQRWDWTVREAQWTSKLSEVESCLGRPGPVSLPANLRLWVRRQQRRRLSSRQKEALVALDLSGQAPYPWAARS